MTAYRSVFGRWDERASVRTRPRRILSGAGELYFAPELVPFLNHPLVAALGEDARHDLLVHRLYQYLHFTVELEEAAVVPVASRIARAQYRGLLPEAMRMDAFAIATDEAWHAQVAYDLIRQVHERTGVEVVVPAQPSFLVRYRQIRDRVEPEHRSLLDIIFSCITETLVTATLAQLPEDSRLPKAVRDVVTDHADDERVHHAYFHQVLSHTWPALSAAQQRALGSHLPALVRAYLDPDVAAMAASLASLGLAVDAIEEVLDDTVIRTPRTAIHTRQAATKTIRYLAEVGALDDPLTREAFALAELTDPSGRVMGEAA